MAIEGWHGLLGDPRTAPRAAAELLRLAAPSRNLPVTRDALRRLEQLNLLPPAQQPLLAFYQLLLEDDASRARQLATNRPPAGSDPNLIAVTLALLALREHQPEQSTRRLDTVNLDWAAAPVAYRVVRVAERGAGGQRSEARALAATLDRALLAPAERELVDPWTTVQK